MNKEEFENYLKDIGEFPSNGKVDYSDYSVKQDYEDFLEEKIESLQKNIQEKADCINDMLIEIHDLKRENKELKDKLSKAVE